MYVLYKAYQALRQIMERTCLYYFRGRAHDRYEVQGCRSLAGRQARVTGAPDIYCTWVAFSERMRIPWAYNVCMCVLWYLRGLPGLPEELAGNGALSFTSFQRPESQLAAYS
jgi:hypothetical protein